jgi:hypothetical protein
LWIDEWVQSHADGCWPQRGRCLAGRQGQQLRAAPKEWALFYLANLMPAVVQERAAVARVGFLREASERGSRGPGPTDPLLPPQRAGASSVISVPTCQSPTARPARSRPHHLSSSGSSERLWSKDQAANRLNHRRSAGRLRLKLINDRNPFLGVVTEARMSNDAAGRLALQFALILVGESDPSVRLDWARAAD